MADSKKMVFAVDSNTVKMKKLLNKEFLQLQMKVISSANPNRNNSWFTPESMVKALPTFKNKPILGYFENGDFVSHNGQWVKDSETDMSYWDTLGVQGERALGVIRSEDEVSVVQDADGLSWITLTCVLWVSYSYKQVKRLIKDAIRAQKSGGATKNISVEVDITDYEMLDGDIMKINDFNLVGITILGSRNGVKVEPGIENAELSVVDMLDKEVYEKQAKALRLAYEKLEGSDNETKEEILTMNEEANATSVVEETIPAAESVSDNTAEAGTGTNTEESTTTETQTSAESTEQANFEANPAAEDCHQNEDEHKDDDPEEDDDDEEEDDEHKDEEQQNCEEQHQNESCPDCGCNEVTTPDPICDLAYLIQHCSWNQENYEYTIEYYEKSEVAHKDAIIAVLKRMKQHEEAMQKELAELLAKVVEDKLTEEDEAYECDLLNHCDCKELYATNKDLTVKLAEANDKVALFEKEKFLSLAKNTINSFNVEEEYKQEIYAKCESGEYSDIEVIKHDVALHIGMSTLTKPVENNNTAVFAAPVTETPTVTAEEKKTKTGARTAWDVMREYNNN